MRHALAIAVFAVAIWGLVSCPKQPAEVETEIAPKGAFPVIGGEKCPEDMAWVPPAKVCIDLFEYPNVSGEVPLSGVTYEEAQGLCGERGKRLPTAKEWELACAGPKELIYPYGEEFVKGTCWVDRAISDTPKPSGHMPRCVSTFGVYDMTGNLWEWTKTEGFERGTKYVRGGSWYSFPSVATCELKAWEPPEGGGKDYGFRCVMKP